jgi:hypothetical protein
LAGLADWPGGGGGGPRQEADRGRRRTGPYWAGGCHLNRPIGELIAGSGLQITELDNYYLDGPKTLGYTFEGRAAKPGAAAGQSG